MKGWVGVGVISILCFVKLASRAFQEYNNKSSGSTGNQSFTCETVGQTSTWKEECCNQSIFSYIIGNRKNEYRKMVIYNGSSVYLRYILWLLCPHCSLQRGQDPALRHHLYPFVLKCMWSLRCPDETPRAWKVTELIFLLPGVPKWYLHDLILSGCGSEGVAESLCSALDWLVFIRAHVLA